MSTANIAAGAQAQQRRTWSPRFDTLGIAVVIVALAAFAATFQYRGALSEYDLYWVLVGILDGHASGLGTGGSMHYGLVISFGYYEAFYHFLSDRVLSDPQRLIAIMNAVGFASALIGLAGLAAAVAFAHGSRTALVTAALFGLSPLYLDLSLSGHPILPASAAFFVGAALLFAETRGTMRVACWTAAVLVLFAGLSFRAEVLIGFPWLVVARTDTRSLGRFFAHAALRAVPPAAAAVIFLIVQQHYNDAHAGGSGAGALVKYLTEADVVSSMSLGFAYILLGVGALTLVATGVAVVFSVRWAKLAPWRTLAEVALGPLALIVPCLILWLPNPMPVRHFLFLDVGVTLLIGMMVARLRWSPLATAAMLLTCVVGNEIVIEAARPTVLAHFHSPYTNFPEARRTLTTAPLGFVWRHHASMQERRDAWDAQARLLPGMCDPHLVVLAAERFEMMVPLLATGERIRFTRRDIGDVDAITATRPNGQVIDFIEAYHWWPKDVVADLLGQPSMDDAAIFAVPYSASIYEKTPVPASRLPHQSCGAQG